MNTFKTIRAFATKKPNFGRSVVIVGAKRTPIGSFMGKLSKVKATELSSIAIKAALESSGVAKEKVDEVILGNVISAGLGQSPARQASLGAQIPKTTPCININKVCASGMKATVYGAQSIGLGLSDTVVTGGFESMSMAPFLIPNMRKGQQYGNTQIIDSVAFDGLTDVYNNCAMGMCGEKTAADLKITRELQDEFCIASYERYIAANKAGKIKNEIAPVKINDKETVDQDEETNRYQKEKIPLLRPAFSKTGTITAGNASKINDGASALVLMAEDEAIKQGLKPLARILSYADHETDPMDFCIAPVKASQRALDYIGKKISDIDYFEINEAFSVTVLANMKLLDLDHEKVNVHGGAVAIGHPIGSSGSRIIMSLINVLKEKKGKLGLASICNGGGGATAIVIENLQ
jgi:acetyl-CoA C-acetyltransferase